MCDGLVTMTVTNGLGNQLFQVAAALAYAKRTGRKCLFYNLGFSNSVFAKRPVYWGTLFDSLPTTTTAFFHTPNVIDLGDSVLGEEKAIDAYPKASHVHLNGLYMSLIHFVDDWDWIRPLVCPSAFEQAAITLLKQHCSSSSFEECAFMHFRRGDLVKIFESPVLNMQYYETSAKLFSDKTWFLVFCEPCDRSTVHQNIQASLALSKRCVFVDDAIPDWMQLLMMSQCPKGGILSNSTFSLWAAYLSVNQPTFVAPKTWYQPIKSHLVYKKNWQVIECNLDPKQRPKMSLEELQKMCTT